jgi:hypothetical protein
MGKRGSQKSHGGAAAFGLRVGISQDDDNVVLVVLFSEVDASVANLGPHGHFGAELAQHMNTYSSPESVRTQRKTHAHTPAIVQTRLLWIHSCMHSAEA